MKIALDYDGTYTADRVLWKAFVKHALERGHEVSFVTFRMENGPMDRCPSNDDILKSSERMGIPVIFSNGQPKRTCFTADIWIDDNPETVFIDYEQCLESGIFKPKELLVEHKTQV